jgi:Starch-binding associating with outer membrane
MKKIILASFSLLMLSCASDEAYEELNKDPNSPTNVSSDALFTSASKALFDQVENPNVNTNIFRLVSQYWTQTTYTDESNFNLIGRAIPDNHWSELYRNVLYDLEDAKTKGISDEKMAQIEVLEIYTWQLLVDTFGDIPYSEALKGANIQQPKYDNDTSIYTSLVSRLNTAILKLSGSGSGFVSSDIIYNGNLVKWKKFANSLKLKIAMRLADSNNALSKQLAEEAFLSGVFTNNTDNAKIQYAATTPNTNPIWVDLVQSGRKDFVISNTFVNKLNSLNDPRRPIFFEENLGANTYVGGAYGDNNSYPLYTHVGTQLLNPTFRGVLLDYSEVEFLLAEAKERMFTITGSAKSHYDSAITANMQDWGVSAGNIAGYLSQTSVDYSLAPGTWQNKIGNQFWIAMYNRGFEGWCVYRKFDTIALNIPVLSGIAVPNRFTYPIREQNLNLINYNNASAAIGGDNLSNKVFWDVN